MRGIFTGKSIRATDGVALALIGVAYLLWFVQTGRELGAHELEYDERGWIASGLRCSRLVASRDFTPQHWDLPRLGVWGNINPPLGKLMIGFPVYRAAEREFLDYAPQKNAGPQDWGGLGPNTRRPPELLLRTARSTARFWGVLASAAMIVASWWFGGRAVAVIFAYTLLFNRIFMHHSVIAYTDTSYLLFQSLAFVSALWLVCTTSKLQRTAAVSVMGICAGLATLIKITGLLIVGAQVVVLLALLVYWKKSTMKGAIGRAVVFVLSALIPIYSLNPFFWPDFSAFNAEKLSIEVDKLRLGDPAFATDTDPHPLWKSLTEVGTEHSYFRETYPQLANVMRPLEFPLLYPRWSRLFENLKKEYPLPSRLDVPYSAVVRYSTSLFEAAFLVYGLYVSILRVRASGGTHVASVTIAAHVALSAQLIFLLFALPVGGFDRYFLPTILVSRLFVALGVAAALEYPRQLVSEMWAKRQSASIETTAL